VSEFVRIPSLARAIGAIVVTEATGFPELWLLQALKLLSFQINTPIGFAARFLVIAVALAVFALCP
jgi:hypothetical protein